VKFVFPILALLLFGFHHGTLAQTSQLKLTMEVPLQIGVGYEGQVSKRFSVGGSVGVLSSPNSDIIISYLKFIGTDDDLVLMIDDAFQLGIVGKVYVNYNFGRNYVGAFALAVGAQAGNVSTMLIENYFNVSLQDYPLLNGKVNSPEDYLRVRTRLYQAGFLFGHRFPLKNNRFEIDAEMGLSGNIGSTSRIYSENRDLTTLSSSLNSSLKEFYKDYAFIPSVGVMLVYKLKMKPGK
jgi:hypothetical protein